MLRRWVLVFDDDEAQETASGGQAGAHGIDAGKHAVEGEGHVVVFGELEDGEHALGRWHQRLMPSFWLRSQPGELLG